MVQKCGKVDSSAFHRLKTNKKIVRRASYGTVKLPSKFGLNMLYGTTMEKEKPEILYIRTRAKVGPNKKTTLGTVKEMGRLHEQITAMFENATKTNPHFENRILSNLEYSAKNLATGKTVFLRYDIHLRPTELDTVPMQYSRVERLASTVERRLHAILNSVGLKIVEEE